MARRIVDSDDVDESDESSTADNGNGFFDLEASESNSEGDDSSNVEDTLQSESWSFPQFSRLPIELRTMVWEAFDPYLKAPQRVCGLRADYPRESSDEPISFCADEVLEQQTQPARTLLSISRESRELALKYYPDCIPCEAGTLRYNANNDIILLDRYGLAVQSRQFAKLADVLTDVRHLAWGPPSRRSEIEDGAYGFFKSHAIFPKLEYVYDCSSAEELPTAHLRFIRDQDAGTFYAETEEEEPGMGEYSQRLYCWSMEHEDYTMDLAWMDNVLQFQEEDIDEVSIMDEVMPSEIGKNDSVHGNDDESTHSGDGDSEAGGPWWIRENASHGLQDIDMETDVHGLGVLMQTTPRLCRVRPSRKRKYEVCPMVLFLFESGISRYDAIVNRAPEDHDLDVESLVKSPTISDMDISNEYESEGIDDSPIDEDVDPSEGDEDDLAVQELSEDEGEPPFPGGAANFSSIEPESPEPMPANPNSQHNDTSSDNADEEDDVPAAPAGTLQRSRRQVVSSGDEDDGNDEDDEDVVPRPRKGRSRVLVSDEESEQAEGENGNEAGEDTQNPQRSVKRNIREAQSDEEDSETEGRAGSKRHKTRTVASEDEEDGDERSSDDEDEDDDSESAIGRQRPKQSLAERLNLFRAENPVQRGESDEEDEDNDNDEEEEGARMGYGDDGLSGEEDDDEDGESENGLVLRMAENEDGEEDGDDDEDGW